MLVYNKHRYIYGEGAHEPMARAENSKNTASRKYRKVSVWNWMGTLILSAIPGVNLIAMILFIIFAKAQAKRSFAVAMLVLMLLGVALTCAAFILFSAELSAFADLLRSGAPVLDWFKTPVA